MTIDAIPITDDRLAYVLLGDERAPTAKALAEFIHEGFYFDASPQFVPPASELNAGPLGHLEVVWDEDRPRVEFDLVDGARLPPVLKEAQALLERLTTDAPDTAKVEHAQAALNRTRQAVRIHFDGETMTESSWMMLDCVEAELARSHQGLVYITNEGFYDSNLQPLVRRPPK